MRNSRLRKTLIAVAAGAVMAATGSASAYASATGSASASAAATLAGRALAEGVSSAQISATQQKVTAFIGSNGGRQVALNEVAFPGGTIVFAIPGVPAKATTAGTVVQYDSSCSYYHFCGWQYDNYVGSSSDGSKIDLVSCGSWTYIPWGSGGSWKNNQSTGTQAAMELTDGSIWYTPGAYSSDPAGNWAVVGHVKPC